jgi:hypothetical protein
MTTVRPFPARPRAGRWSHGTASGDGAAAAKHAGERAVAQDDVVPERGEHGNSTSAVKPQESLRLQQLTWSDVTG